MKLYQTLALRGGTKEIEGHGPYKCVSSEAWLGEGYYLWLYDRCAHWWGRVWHGGKYIIGEIECSDNPGEVLDLSLDPRDIATFADVALSLAKRPEKGCSLIRAVASHPHFWKNERIIKAISVRTENTVGHEHEDILPRLYFDRHLQFMPYFPMIQYCVTDTSFFRGAFHVVYRSS